MQKNLWTKAPEYNHYGDVSPRDLADAFAEVAALRLKLQRTLSAIGKSHLIEDAPSDVVIESADCLVQTEITNRARRSTILPPELFFDPAWDMLLELYRAELQQYRLSVSNLCVASNAPASTALRWIGELERKALVERHADKLDRRRFCVRLTEAGMRSMARYFLNGKADPIATQCAT